MQVALYARTKNQKAELLARASREGWDYEYFEEQETTRKTRPVKYELYQRLLKKEFDAVVVWKLDCWAQSLVELITEIDMLYSRDVKFVSIKDPIDLTNDMLALYQIQILKALADFQRTQNSTKIKDSFYKDINGITKSKKTGKAVGQRGKDKRKRRKAGYYKRWDKKTGCVN